MSDSPPSLLAAREERRDILSLLTLTLLCYFDKILLGPRAVIDFYDTLEVHFAHFKAMGRLWAEFGAFSWYPFHAGGMPSFVGQHPPYHPAVFLSLVLPIWLLALLWNIAQMFLAGYGMYRFLRLLARTSRQTALAIAALFSITWISGNIHIVMSYAFPAFFCWTADLCRRDLSRLARLRSAALLLLVSLFSFPVLTLPHFPIFHLALVLFLGRHLPDFRRQVAGVFFVWTGYVLLFLPSIAGLYFYIPYAQRVWDFGYSGLGHALLDFARWFRGRLSDQPLLPLVFLGLPLLKERSIRVCFILLAAIMVVAGVFSSELKALFQDSLLLKMDLFLFTTAVGIVGPMIAALLLEAYRQGSARISWPAVLLIVALLPLFGAAYKVLTYLFILGYVLSAMLLLRGGQGTPLSRLRWAAVALAVCLAGAGMFLRQQSMANGVFVPYAEGYLGHADLGQLAAKGRAAPFRVACLDVHPALIQSFGLDTVGGKSPLFNGYYKEYVREIIRPQLSTPEQFSGFDNLWRQLYLTRNHVDHDQRGLTLAPARPRTAADFNWPLLLAMNVTHVISAFPVSGMDEVAVTVSRSPGLDAAPPWLKALGLASPSAAQPLWIYALRDPQLRAYLARPVILESRAQVLEALGATGAQDAASRAYLAQEDIAGLQTRAGLAGTPPAAGPLGEVRISSWSPDRLVLEGRAEAPCVLVVSNNFAPHWKASSASGANLPVFRANHAFQGLAIDAPGPFRLELTYSDPLIWWLHLASGLGALLLFWGCFAPQAAPARVLDEGVLLPGGPGLTLPWRLWLCAGVGIAALWATGFALFVLGRAKAPQAETFGYALRTIPVIGLFIVCWCRVLVRRISGPA